MSPIPIHPTWFDEKSGGAVCAAAAKVSVQAPAKMPPRSILLIKNVDMLPLLGSFPRCPHITFTHLPPRQRRSAHHERDRTATRGGVQAQDQNARPWFPAAPTCMSVAPCSVPSGLPWKRRARGEVDATAKLDGPCARRLAAIKESSRGRPTIGMSRRDMVRRPRARLRRSTTGMSDFNRRATLT